MIKTLKALYLGFAGPLPVNPDRKDMQIRLQHFIDLLHKAMGPGIPEMVAVVLRNLSDHSDDIRRAIVLWVRLIEMLVQSTEHRYPSSHGALKKADVKAAAKYIFSSKDFALPGIPADLQPIFVDVAVDWIIDMVVSATNHYDLWAPETPEPPSISGFIRMAIKKFKLWTKPFWLWIAGIFARLYVALQYSEPLSPELLKAVEEIRAEGLFINMQDFLRVAVEVVVFIGNHGPQVIAMSDLLFEAVREAERFISLSGRQKKAYASDVVLTVLSELGFPVDSGLIGMIMRSFVDAGIDSAVDVFNRRDPEAFKHRQIA